jgi:hypothetical protein
MPKPRTLTFRFFFGWPAHRRGAGRRRAGVVVKRAATRVHLRIECFRQRAADGTIAAGILPARIRTERYGAYRAGPAREGIADHAAVQRMDNCLE